METGESASHTIYACSRQTLSALLKSACTLGKGAIPRNFPALQTHLILKRLHVRANATLTLLLIAQSQSNKILRIRKTDFIHPNCLVFYFIVIQVRYPLITKKVDILRLQLLILGL